MIKVTSPVPLIYLATLTFLFSCASPKKVVETKPATPVKKVTTPTYPYRATATRAFDLIHTKLEVSFDWTLQQMPATAEITLKPHFYESNKLFLNARGMAIKEVKLVKGGVREEVPYEYRNDSICITLDKMYNRNDTITVYVDYVSRPEDLPTGGSSAITSDKGLYFINADNSDPLKPQQIWTQGETQAASVWFPTIDWPNQKSTQEIYITVDTAFVTLSNGRMLSSVVNSYNGTRTDYWRQDLPHAPYLFMMAIGKFAVVKDSWRGKEVSYYVEPEFGPYAKAIFGNTPEMMEFFSKLLGVDYVWDKYSQVVVRDYVSGAMENTSASLFGEFMQKDARGLLDGNNEDVISHEMIHQWFGDLVTCESWSNLVLNESFATYGEYLWNEYKYGADEADYSGQRDLMSYLREARGKQVDLVRFNYKKQEDMFDSHSYAKGGRVLHMLRSLIGDDAFFESLRIYLERYKFGTAEVHQLRLIMEEVTGTDLNWFFNQWFYSAGHPDLRIEYRFDEVLLKVFVKVKQQQDTDIAPIYRLPVAIDIYSGNDKFRKEIIITELEQEFSFNVTSKPDLVNFDAEKMLVATKNDLHSNPEWITMFHKAPKYLDRYESLNKLATNYVAGTPEADVVKKALSDPHWNIRLLALKNVKNLVKDDMDGMKKVLLKKAAADDKSDVRELAIERLMEFWPNDEEAGNQVRAALNDSSYNVMETALGLIIENNRMEGLSIVRALENDPNKNIAAMVSDFYALYGSDEQFDFMIATTQKAQGFDKYGAMQSFGKFLLRCSPPVAEKGLAELQQTGTHHEQWFVRLSAVQALAEIAKSYGKNQSTSNTTATQPGDDVLKQRTELLNENVRKKAAEIVETIKAQEKDENLIRIYSK
jgi:aminopeptidase N